MNNVSLPNFFIVGASKAGTSSLWSYLKGHPEIFMPESNLHKEPAFFCNIWGMKSWERYLELFKDAVREHRRIGEASTAYLTCPDSAMSLFKFSAEYGLDVKIIITLRNPADRAYSLYNWNVQSGIEPASSFEKALELEPKRTSTRLPRFWLPGGYRYQYLYFHSGLYSEQVERYMANFCPDNIHIEIFEEFVANIRQRLGKVCRFLGVTEEYHPVLSVHNPSFTVLSPKLQVLFRQITRKLIRFKIIRNFSTIEERDRLGRLGLCRKRPRPIDARLRQSLLSRYRDDIVKLGRLIKKDMLDIWR